jgi:hypothetical protein
MTGDQYKNVIAWLGMTQDRAATFLQILDPHIHKCASTCSRQKKLTKPGYIAAGSLRHCLP